jgi:hypothetical protein
MVVAALGSNGCGLGSDVAFHLLIQIIFDFGLSFLIFLLLTNLLYLLISLLYLSITSLISACVAADFFVKYLPHLMVNEKNQLPFMIAWRLALLHWKSTLWWPWQLSWLHQFLLCLSHHFTHHSWCCDKRFCEMSTAPDGP